MTLEQFITLQEELFYAFGWFARWWLIFFAVGSVSLSAFLFVLSVINSWLETR